MNAEPAEFATEASIEAKPQKMSVHRFNHAFESNTNTNAAKFNLSCFTARKYTSIHSQCHINEKKWFTCGLNRFKTGDHEKKLSTGC